MLHVPVPQPRQSLRTDDDAPGGQEVGVERTFADAIAPEAAPAARWQAEPERAPAAAPAERDTGRGVAAPVAQPPAARDPATPFVLPMDALSAVAESAGLNWVNSDAAKIQAAQEAMATMPAPARVPREVRKVELAEDGPLVLVETKKDLSQVRLPFESEPAGPRSA